MAPHSSTLAWQIPWTEEPGGLQSMGSLRVGHDWATSLSLFSFIHWRRKWQPTPVFLPGESQGRGSLVGCRLWGCTGLDTTERLNWLTDWWPWETRWITNTECQNWKEPVLTFHSALLPTSLLFCNKETEEENTLGDLPKPNKTVSDKPRIEGRVTFLYSLPCALRLSGPQIYCPLSKTLLPL